MIVKNFLFLNNSLYKNFIAYIFKIKFYINNFIIIEYPVLIPRNETIILLKFLKKKYVKVFFKHCMDLGTGSGLLPYIFKYSDFKNNLISVDIEFLSIYCSKKNKLENKYIKIFHLNWNRIIFLNKKIDHILINPPYLSKDDIDIFFSNFIFEHENSLIFNKKELNIFIIIKYIYNILNNNGVLMLEHGYYKSKMIRNNMRTLGFRNIFTYKDNNGIFRFTSGEK
jgi:release factor glutamine methyltransferase